MVAETTSAPAAIGAGGKATLFKHMAEVLAEVERVKKNGFNKFFNYRYATESDLVDVLRPALAKHHIAVFFTVLDIQTIDMKGAKNGDIARIHVRATFACGETGETYDVDWYGDGQDPSDKALNKAYTAAVKYLLLKTFLVSTGDDPDAEGGEPGQAQQSVSGGPAQQPRPAQPSPRPAEPPANGKAQPPAPAPAEDLVSMTLRGKEWRVPRAFLNLSTQDQDDFAAEADRLLACETMEALKAEWTVVYNARASTPGVMFGQLERVKNRRKKLLEEAAAREGTNGRK